MSVWRINCPTRFLITDAGLVPDAVIGRPSSGSPGSPHLCPSCGIETTKVRSSFLCENVDDSHSGPRSRNPQDRQAAQVVVAPGSPFAIKGDTVASDDDVVVYVKAA